MITADKVEKRTAGTLRGHGTTCAAFLGGTEASFGEHQFSFAPQIELNDHLPVGESVHVFVPSEAFMAHQRLCAATMFLGVRKMNSALQQGIHMTGGMNR